MQSEAFWVERRETQFELFRLHHLVFGEVFPKPLFDGGPAILLREQVAELDSGTVAGQSLRSSPVKRFARLQFFPLAGLVENIYPANDQNRQQIHGSPLQCVLDRYFHFGTGKGAFYIAQHLDPSGHGDHVVCVLRLGLLLGMRDRLGR